MSTPTADGTHPSPGSHLTTKYRQSATSADIPGTDATRNHGRQPQDALGRQGERLVAAAPSCRTGPELRLRQLRPDRLSVPVVGHPLQERASALLNQRLQPNTSPFGPRRPPSRNEPSPARRRAALHAQTAKKRLLYKRGARRVPRFSPHAPCRGLTSPASRHTPTQETVQSFPKTSTPASTNGGGLPSRSHDRHARQLRSATAATLPPSRPSSDGYLLG